MGALVKSVSPSVVNPCVCPACGALHGKKGVGLSRTDSAKRAAEIRHHGKSSIEAKPTSRVVLKAEKAPDAPLPPWSKPADK